MKTRKVFMVDYTGRTKDVLICATTMEKALSAGKALHPKATIEQVRRAYNVTTVYIPEL